MKIYLGIKFHPDHANKILIEKLTSHLERLGHSTFCIAKDLEKWGENAYDSKSLMNITFEKIDNSDLTLIEFSEKGVGLGIEAGYSFAKGIPVFLVAKKGTKISTTIDGVASKIIFYDEISDIKL